MKNIKKVILMMLVLSMLVSVVAYASTCTYYTDGVHRYVDCPPQNWYNIYTKSGTALNSDGYMERVVFEITDKYLETRCVCACGEFGAPDYDYICSSSKIIKWTGAIV
ncbi:hypothetical protein JYG23_14640 [Sedimentibacter sp. zth1]|uniref:hypothetical protein n=1 Tax=Sedimentibacter sp. zth1 TaxID=2816908 RepID=UPI001A91D946|nr:hypothetical protein [Sedimentibacter sp. zth1]QSX05879.1 hypothetical protein JYG23_14640 [Sedimentibacter sp. zth1]